MRRAVLVLALGGCNALLDIHDLGATQGGTCVDDSDCTGAPHEVCDAQVCACAAGYAGAPCAWAGVVSDPGFSAAASAWAVGGVATSIDPQAAGLVEPGVAHITSDPANCSLFAGRIEQHVTMPRASVAEPLVLALTDAADDPLSASRGVGIDAVWDGARYPAFAGDPNAAPSFASSRTCLGAGQYAAETTTGLGADALIELVYVTSTCTAPTTAYVDHLDLVPAEADECPAFGTVTNGDAEASNGWMFAAGAAYTETSGDHDSRGIVLSAATTCDAPLALTPASFPLATPTASPALSLYYVTSPSASLVLYVDDVYYPLPTAPMGTTTRVCVPAPLRGAVANLGAQLGIVGTDCQHPAQRTAVLDSFVLQNDPACGTDPLVADPSFEVAPPPNIVVTSGASVTQEADGLAHGGTHDVALALDATCGEAAFTTYVLPPPVLAPGEGAAVTLWYRTTSPAPTLVIDSGTGGNTATMIAPIIDGAWHQATACVRGDVDAGHRKHVLVKWTGTACELAGDVIVVDDLAVTSSPACAP